MVATPAIKAEEPELTDYEYEDIIECKDENDDEFNNVKEELLETVEANAERKTSHVNLKIR